MRLNHVTLVLALLASGAVPAVAQQTELANAAQAPESAASAAPYQSPSIKRWVDAKGTVHYGDRQPRHAPAQEVGSTQSSATPEEKAQAAAQLERDRRYLVQPVPVPVAGPAQASYVPPPQQAPYVPPQYRSPLDEDPDADRPRWPGIRSETWLDGSDAGRFGDDSQLDRLRDSRRLGR